MIKVDHELKVWPPHYQAVQDDDKPFEIRRADRPYKVGDLCLMREYKPATHGFPGNYTTRACYRRICYVLVGGEFGMLPGFVVIGIKPDPSIDDSTPVPLSGYSDERRDTRP